MSPDQITVVVPTYNERENLADIAAAITDQGYFLCVVDDGSPDGTGAIADSLSATDPRISVIHRPRKEGLGPAYTEAFNALIAGESRVIIEMDADFSHDPADLPRLVEAVEDGADLAIGSRYVAGGSTPDWPIVRQLVSKTGNLYARIMLGIPIRDATAGFRAFRREALAQLPYEKAEASGYGFQVEMAWRAVEKGLNVVEVPIAFRDRTRGKSKMGLAIVTEAMWLVTVWGFGRLVRRNK